MLPSTPDIFHTALNRVTFGARDLDVADVRNRGWEAWLTEQLNPPPGDDPALAQHIASQTMRINYGAPGPNDTRGTWTATDEMRPLNYINAETPTLWNVAANAGRTFSFAERTRISQELAAATWMRNAHGKYQLREFMVDFWHNHFNIGKNENQLATAILPVYDRIAIRPHALGNFRAMLEANATSTSMLMYLDNYVSSATTPNENYAREIMELHTLGGAAYLGTTNPADVPKDYTGVAIGFTDQDIIQASRVLSGWTVRYGQRGEGTSTLPSTGEFAFNIRQHNRNATTLLGVSMTGMPNNDMTQGRRFLDIIAYHPATAAHVVTKLAKRVFGDTPPQAVVDRGVNTWMAHLNSWNQIGATLSVMIAGGPEIFTAPIAKVRRPYERIIALARTTDTVLSPATFMTSILDPQNDGLFSWPAPDGRPDVNKYWLATGSMLATWNLMFTTPMAAQFNTTLTNQTPLSATTATAIVEYWVGRMVGYALKPEAMNALVNDQAGANGVLAAARAGGNRATRIENAYRRLISLIATTEEFSLR